MVELRKFHDEDSQPIDTRIQAALEQVPIPAGLLQRLQDAVAPDLVAERPSVQSTTQDSPLTNINIEGLNASASSYKDLLRRAAIVLALAGALAGLAILANQWRQPLERSWLQAHSQAILEKWEQQNLAGLDSANLKLPAAIQQQLVRVNLVGSLPLSALGSKLSGTLYRLDANDGRGIVLLKLTKLPAIRGLSSRFVPLNSPSGGWSLAAVTINNETFVLAAVGTEQQLFNYIHRPAVT